MNIFIIAIFLLGRISLFFIAWIGEKILPFSPRFPYWDILLIPSHLPSWVWSFANFDGVHYLTIANTGYSAQFTQVFFPVYPMLIGIFQKLIFVNPIIIGLVISNLFFLFDLILFSRLLSLDYKTSQIKWTLLFLLIFPTAFFFGSIYTESLFFFLVIASFYTARKKKWFLAGILGGIASATRLIGIFLLPALLWEYYICHPEERKRRRIPLGNMNMQGILHGVYTEFIECVQNDIKSIFHSPILYLVPLGLISYMLYLQIAFGDALYFWHAQPVFGAERLGNSIILFPQVVWRYLKIFATLPITLESYWISMGEFISTMGSLLLLYIAYRKKVRPSYILFSFLSIIIPTLTGTFSSMPRYVLMSFPMFISLGAIKSRLLKIIFLFVFFLFLLLLTLLFIRGHWVA